MACSCYMINIIASVLIHMVMQAWGWMEWKEGSLELARKYYKQSLSINSRNMEAARTFHVWHQSIFKTLVLQP